MRTRPLVLLASLLLLAPPLAAEDSLDLLSGFAERIEKGMSASLSGTEPDTAFGPWKVAGADALPDLQKAGATSARFVAMELELLFRKDGRNAYSVRTLVHVSRGKAALVKLSGEALDEDESAVVFHPMDELPETAAPLAGAARALAALLAGSGEVPIADVADLESILPFAPAREELAKGIQEARDRLGRVREEVRALGAPEIRVRVDDAPCLAQDADGNALGIVKTEIDVLEDGIAIDIGRFRPFPSGNGKGK